MELGSSLTGNISDDNLAKFLRWKSDMTLLRDTLQLFAVELRDVLDRIFVDGVDHVQHFHSFSFALLEERTVLDGFHVFPGNVVDGLLPVLHVLDVLLEGGIALARRR